MGEVEVWFYRPGKTGGDLIKFNPGSLSRISEYAELYPNNVYFEAHPSHI